MRPRTTNPRQGSRAARSIAAATAVTLATAIAAATSSQAGPPRISLGPTVRITTPGTALCPAEGEPETTVTSAGTWVAYNDDHECPLSPHLTRLMEVQLVPAQGGKPRFIPIKPASGQQALGDPDLAPDPRGDGSVFLASLWVAPNQGSLSLRILHIDSRLRVRELPSPSFHGSRNSDDKEFIATDTGRHSRWRGRLYVAWDDFSDPQGISKTVFRAWDGQAWTHPVVLQFDVGAPDVAVAPDGDVAVGYETSTGVAVRVSHDGGRTFAGPVTVFTGGSPGAFNPSCPLRPSIGSRQRAMRDVRVAYDRGGALHVVASMGELGPSGLPLVQGAGGIPSSAAGVSGVAVIHHAVVRGGRVTARTTVTPPTGGEQWAPAVAALRGGGVGVAWLQTSDPAKATYDAWLAVLPPRSRSFAPAVRLSTASSVFASGTEAMGNSNCYGIGDYIGMSTTRHGVEVVWPTTNGTSPQVDSDVLMRPAVVR